MKLPWIACASLLLLLVLAAAWRPTPASPHFHQLRRFALPVQGYVTGGHDSLLSDGHGGIWLSAPSPESSPSPPPPPSSPPPPSPSPPPPSPPPPSPPPPSPPPPPPPPPPSPPPPSPPPPSPPPPSPPPPSPPPPSPPPPPATNAVLANIILSAGTLTPTFDPLVFTYDAAVSSGVSSIQITVYLPDDELTTSYNVLVNGSAVESGVASSELILADYGQTVSVIIYIFVDGYVPSTYTIYITRGNKNGLSPWYIALIVIAIVVVLGLIAYVIYWAYKGGLIPGLPPRSTSDHYQTIPQA